MESLLDDTSSKRREDIQANLSIAKSEKELDAYLEKRGVEIE
jgi:hypothetical protein